MKFKIKHEIKGRIRVRAIVKHMTVKEADLLEYALSNKEGITSVRVNERTADVVLCYKTDRATVLSYLRKCHIEEIEAPESYLAHSGRALNNEYWDKLVGTVAWRFTKKLFVPAPIRTCITLAAAIPYIWKGVKTLVKGKLEVPVLDATAIAISIARGDVSTASSVMFLLGIGEILEEWTHKKSVGDLARSMSLNVSKVWMLTGEQEILVDASTIKENDKIVIHMGNVIPFDGTVESGEGMVNQASMTGESAAVRKYAGTTVYAGTVLEEGELTLLAAGQVHLGVGEETPLSDGDMSVREALAALKTAQVEGDRVVCWADLHHDAFRAAANEGRLFWRTAALHRALLEEHDDLHGTELAATAEAVARAYGDLRLAAEALHQHPNTVRYRLRKAKDVLGMPDSPDREFAFLLGLVYLDYTNPLLQP